MDYSLSEIQSQEESETFDFKRFEAIKNSKKFAKHLVGFANRRGGKIALGFTDTGDLKGQNIDYDQVMQTITNIAYSRCSPQVRFTDDFKSTPDGDLLILNISSREGIPHAVVEREEGTITCRDYWIRTKNTTRRVSDVELDRLFSTKLDPDFTKEFETWAMISVDNHQPPSINLPNSIANYKNLFNKLEINEKYKSDQNLYISNIIMELFPFSFLYDLNKIHFATWDTTIQNSTTPFQGRSLIQNSNMSLFSSDDLNQNHETETVKISEDDIQFVGFEDTQISNFVDKIDLLDDIRFHTLPDTEFVIEYSIDDVDSNEDVLPFPQYDIKIQRQDEFQITVSSRGKGAGRGFPTEHPITDVAADNKFRRLDLADMQEKWEYSEIRNHFNAEFGFPDEPDTDIELNERYAKRLWHLIEKQYSVKKFLETLPDTEIYKANHKLDMIVEALFE